MARPIDIVSPIKDQMLAPKTSAEDARRDGRMPYEKPTQQKPSCFSSTTRSA